jgi:hypothetical protein
MPLKVVRVVEIERILALTDRLGIHREAVTIPLKPATPGSVRRLPDGRYEILVEGERDLDQWLPELEERLRALMGNSG